ncbi:hypothetical protein C1Y40_01609 [Mycobacterium talmoniae]|uniref:Uncharacterized protein n=1 Tax=Mycobacterium talmoniae TaxID=1858794 RepID=A0A2S8BNH2_9MYCO|nr:hypothetical protein C1Y40_01609 [Mycobacterium talmoniae]
MCCGQHMVAHCAPRPFNTSLNLLPSASGVVVLISSQVPASVYSGSGTSRCCHSMASSRSASSRSLVSPSALLVPKRSPCTASSTAPCSSSTSRSASTPEASALVTRV